MWHVAPSCWNQMLPISFSSIFVNKNSLNMARQQSPLTVPDSPCSFSKKNDPIMPVDQNPRRLFNVCVRVFCAPNATILLVYIPAKIKMSFIRKDDFFFAKIGIFWKSIAGPFPSVGQAYAQPYSFGGRIKLIVCQIRHELTIHEISFSWRKNVR